MQKDKGKNIERQEKESNIEDESKKRQEDAGKQKVKRK